jgi:MoaA/NifB/PqqE/SkfB family radical SAM enzyme
VRLNAVGGEPFILPAWRRFLREYRGDENPHLCFSTCTSASLISEDIFEQLTRFKTININVSVDGTGSVYEQVRVNARWRKVVENIGRLKAIVDRKPGSAIGLSMSVMRSNVADLANFIRFAADLGLLF